MDTDVQRKKVKVYDEITLDRSIRHEGHAIQC